MKYRNSLLTIMLSLCMIITTMVPAFAEEMIVDEEGVSENILAEQECDEYVAAPPAPEQLMSQEDTQEGTEEAHECIIALHNELQTSYIDYGDGDYFAVYPEDFDITDAVTGEQVPDSVKRDLTEPLYYKWTNEKGKVLLKGVGKSVYQVKKVAKKDFDKIIKCEVFKSKKGKSYGYTTFTSKYCIVEQGKYSYDINYVNGYSVLEYIPGQSRTIDVTSILPFDDMRICRLDEETGKYVPCYSSVLMKHITYKWSVTDGKIIGAKNRSKVTVLPNEKTVLNCDVYLYGECAFTLSYRTEKLEVVGFEGYKYDPSVFAGDNDRVYLKAVEWKKGALPATAAFRYTKSVYELEGDFDYVGRKTHSPYAKDSLRGIADLKGTAMYTCEIYKNMRATEPMYTIYFYAFPRNEYEWMKTGETVSAASEEDAEGLIIIDRLFRAPANARYILSYNMDNVDSFVSPIDAWNGGGRYAYDNANDYVIYGKRGKVYSISAFEEGKAKDVLEMSLRACEHKNLETVDYKAATETSRGYTGDVVCCKCGKIIKNGKVIPRVK